MPGSPRRIPLLFKVDVPRQGNYKVTLTIRSEEEMGEVLIFTGRRRLAFHGCVQAGEFTYTMAVNVCDIVPVGHSHIFADKTVDIAVLADRPRISALTVEEMNNGVAELDAYKNFADRCAIKEIRRFSSTMIQNMQKGNSEIAYFLKEMSDEMWEEKKHLVKRKGEAANSKLLIPTAMIFMGILVLVMAPTFLSM